MILNATSGPIGNSPAILWDNVFTKGAIATVGTVASDGPSINALSQSTNDAWKCTAVGGGSIAVTLGASTVCNAVGIAAHNLSGKVVTVAKWTGAAYATVATFTPADNSPIMVRFDGDTATQWRLSVASGPFNIGVAFIGQALDVPGVIQPPHTPLNLCEEVELLGGSQSRSGQFLGQDVSIFAGRANLQFEVQQPSFAMDGFNAFRRHFNRGGAFFIACAPTAWPNDMGYCWRNGAEIVPPWKDAVFMDLAMEVGVYNG